MYSTTTAPPRKNTIAIVGCSKSINSVTKAEADCINSCSHVYALNKFMAFYYLTHIRPTHVWFTVNDPPADQVLQYIFDLIEKDKLNGLKCVVQRPLDPLDIKVIYDRLIGSRWRQLCYYHRYPSNRVLGKIVGQLPILQRWCEGSLSFQVPRRVGLKFVHINKEWDGGGQWARNLRQPLYQFLTSFTSLLNYVSIVHPHSDVLLVGSDFSSGGYFFDDEMERLKINWDDWTSAPQRSGGTYAAALNLTGKGTLFDRFPEIQEHLSRSGVRLIGTNSDSELVRRGFVEYSKITEWFNPRARVAVSCEPNIEQRFATELIAERV